MRQINLLPQELLQTEQMRTVRNALLSVLAPALGGLLILHGLLSWEVRRLEVMVKRPLTVWDSSEISQLQSQIDRITSQNRESVKPQQDLLLRYLRQENFPDLLTNVANSAANKIWLRELRLGSEPKSLVLTGRSFQTQLVSEFMLELKKIPYFSQVKLDTMGKGSNSSNPEIEFQVTCFLK